MKRLIMDWADLYASVGPFFVLAFVVVMVCFIVLVLMFYEERKRLCITASHLQKLILAIETGKLFHVISQKVEGQPVDCPIEEQDFGQWLDLEVFGIDSAEIQKRIAVKKYLAWIISTDRKILLPDDNRIKLTGVRNFLKHRSFHQFIGVVLATSVVSLGILGTASGVYLAFSSADFTNITGIALSMENVMVALSKALYTTGIGLTISIPMIFMAFYMEKQMEKIYDSIQLVQDAVKATVKEARGKANGLKCP